MKRTLLVVLTAVVLLLLATSAASAFGLKDVVRMHKDGIADSLIIQKIEYSGKTFRLNARDMRELKEAEVSDDVISAMLRTEARDDEDYYDRRYSYGYVHDYYPRTRLYLGFGRGGYYPYGGDYGDYCYYPYYSSSYYGTYRYRRYSSYGGYTGYRVPPTGQWGNTRYRDHVGQRIYSGSRHPSAYRQRAGSAHPGTGVRTRHR